MNLLEKKNTAGNSTNFLTTCFEEQIGVQMDKPQSLNIFNLDETLIAKGFDRVVVTWHGVFWEHTRNDICFRNLESVDYPEEGTLAWRANGVRVFQLTKPDNRRRP